MIRSIRWLAGIACVVLSTAAAANLQTLRAQARAGVPKAQFELGELYQFGVGRPDHLQKALKWYRRAEAHVPRAALLARRVAAQLAADTHARVAQPLHRAPAARVVQKPARKPKSSTPPVR
ncbi:MAG: SEL1-like repeat protein [Gammaproteobacteria bacterium]|nr:SEL1-like repeat protein [Gammaproteobacteria bacterium]